MLLRWLEKRGRGGRNLTQIGVAAMLLALFAIRLGTNMNSALEQGAETFLGFPLNEAVCIAVLMVGSVLMGISVVFNVTGIRLARRRG